MAQKKVRHHDFALTHRRGAIERAIGHGAMAQQWRDRNGETGNTSLGCKETEAKARNAKFASFTSKNNADALLVLLDAIMSFAGVSNNFLISS